MMISRLVYKLISKAVNTFFKYEDDFWLFYWSHKVKMIGENTRIYGYVKIKGAENVTIGNRCTINRGVYIVAKDAVVLGDNVRISPNVMIMTGGLDFTAAKPYPHYSRPILIGDNTWIGTGAIVLAGVRIGNNCVIAAGTIVNKNVEDNSLVAGNPGVIKRKL